MYKKYISLLALLAWAGTQQASDGATQVAAFAHINNLLNSSKNIFEDTYLLDAIKRRISDVNTWLGNELKTNKSDTLKAIFVRISGRASGISSNLGVFSSNMSSLKADNATLTQFRKMAQNFSQDRDALKNELKPGSKLDTFKKHKKPLLRSAAREEVKQEVADVLMAYADTFVKIAQKAVTDFARIDGALYIEQEKPGLKMVTPALLDMPKKPASSLMQDSASSTSFTRAADMYEAEQAQNAQNRSSNTWEGWDSE